MLRWSPTSFIKLTIIRWSPSCCLSNILQRRKRQMDTGERRITRQLDIVHFIQNAIMLKALTKLSLSKTDRFLVRRQPKVHLLLNQKSSSSSDSTKKLTATNAYCYQGENLSSYGAKLVDLYFGTKEKASEPRNVSTTSTVMNQ